MEKTKFILLPLLKWIHGFFFLQTPSEDKAKSHALIIPNLIVTVKPEQCFLLELFLRLPAQIDLGRATALWRRLVEASHNASLHLGKPSSGESWNLTPGNNKIQNIHFSFVSRPERQKTDRKESKSMLLQDWPRCCLQPWPAGGAAVYPCRSLGPFCLVCESWQLQRTKKSN